MNQYCRYCSHFCIGNGNYCEAKGTNPTDSYAKSVNHCKEFDFCEIDAYYAWRTGDPDKAIYRPRGKYKHREKRMKQCDGQIKLDFGGDNG